MEKRQKLLDKCFVNNGEAFIKEASYFSDGYACDRKFEVRIKVDSGILLLENLPTDAQIRLYGDEVHVKFYSEYSMLEFIRYITGLTPSKTDDTIFPLDEFEEFWAVTHRYLFK